jgi:hypothetical protein
MRSVVLLFAAALAFGQDAHSLASITERQARTTVSSMRVQGQVGGSLDFRVTSTDRSYNYKLRATWITPAVATAAARLLMLTKGYTETQAEEVIKAVASAESWMVLVELDPREGSGVIPNDWLARFGAKGRNELQAVGHQVPVEGIWRSLAAGFPRDYSYDVFLLKFPRDVESVPVLRPSDTEAELVVRIFNKQGHVRWRIPAGAVR